MIKVTMESPDYTTIPRHRLKRYVRKSYAGKYFWCEVDEADRRYDVRQGDCDENDLPAAVADEADRRAGTWPAAVEWPIAENKQVNRRDATIHSQYAGGRP